MPPFEKLQDGLIEGLAADSEAIDPQRANRRQGCLIQVSRIGLQGDFRIRQQREVLPNPFQDCLKLPGIKKRRGTASYIDRIALKSTSRKAGSIERELTE
jgi:hypothetical protein